MLSASPCPGRQVDAGQVAGHPGFGPRDDHRGVGVGGLQTFHEHKAGARTGPGQHDQVNARRDCFLERYGSSADRQSAAPKRDGCEDSKYAGANRGAG